MNKKVRCLVCNDVVAYVNDDTSSLVAHLNQQHGGRDVFRFLGHSPNEKGEGQAVQGENISVDEWKPGSSKNVHCHHCGYDGIPYVRCKREKRRCGMLGEFCGRWGCWPFYYWPYLFSTKPTVYTLYCHKCNKQLGVYQDKAKEENTDTEQ